jgi:hypothetical protein
VIKLTANESLVVCDVECFFPASAIVVSVHLEEHTVLVVKDYLAQQVFFLLHDHLDLADMFVLINIKKLIACPTSTSLTS